MRNHLIIALALTALQPLVSHPAAAQTPDTAQKAEPAPNAIPIIANPAPPENPSSVSSPASPVGPASELQPVLLPPPAARRLCRQLLPARSQ